MMLECAVIASEKTHNSQAWSGGDTTVPQQIQLDQEFCRGDKTLTIETEQTKIQIID